MNPQEDPRFPIIALKGLPITIIALLCMSKWPVTQARLCDLIDSTDKTMSKALHRLEEFQICTHREEGWSVTTNVAILGFCVPEWLQEAVEPDEPVDKTVDTCPVNGFPQEKGRNFCDSSPLTTGSTSSINSTGLDLDKGQLPGPDPEPDVLVEKGRNFSDSSSLTTSSTSSIKLTNLKLEENLLLVDPVLEFESEPELELEQDPEPEPEAKTETEQKPTSSERIQECFKTALAAGIWSPKAMELAEMPHVTPELINYHVAKVQAEKKEIPLAIYRIKFDKSSKKPPAQENQDWEDQDRENRHRYVKGKHSDWINH